MSKDLAIKENELQSVQWDMHEVEEQKPLVFSDNVNPLDFGIEVLQASSLVAGIDVITSELSVLKDAYIDVITLEVNTENISIFKDLRKSFTKNRTSAEKLRTAKKAYFLNGGRFVDAIFKDINAQRELMECKLLEAEKFFENKAKEEKLKLNTERIKRIAIYIEDTLGLDFSDMNDYDFDDYVLGKKTRFEIEAKEKEIEVLRIADELKKEIERQKAIEAENAKLKLEAEIKEKELTKEREKAEKERQIESDKQSKIQAIKDAEIAKLKQDAEFKLQAELQAQNNIKLKEDADTLAAENLLKAPVKKQLKEWVDKFEIPLSSVENELSLDIKNKFQAFKKWSLTEINKL